MKKLFQITFINLLLLTFVFSPLTASEQAEAVLEKAVNKITSILKSGQSTAAKRKAISDLYYANFDTDALARATLRRAYKTELNKAQKKKFTQKFAEFILYYYTQKIDSYNNNKIVFDGSRTLRKNRLALVRTKVETEGSMAQVNYSMIKRGGAWKVYDVEIEGVKLSTTYRSQFVKVLKNKGFSGLMYEIDKLIAKTR